MAANNQEALRLYQQALYARRQLIEIDLQLKAQGDNIEVAKTNSKRADWGIYGLGLGLLGVALFDVQHNVIEWFFIGLAGVGVIALRLFRAVQLDAHNREQARLASTRDLIKAANPSLVSLFIWVDGCADPSDDEARQIVERIAKTLPQMKTKPVHHQSPQA